MIPNTRWRPGLPVLPVLALLLVTALLPAVPCEAQTPRTEHTLRLDDGTARPAASIADVAWLTGRWEGEGLGARAEEAWLPSVGGAMVGVFRLVRGDSVQFYELVTLAEEEGSLVLRLKHFDPDLVGWEEESRVVGFPLVRRTADALCFDGLTIRRLGEDGMRVWVALEAEGEGVREAMFEYRRAPTRE